MKACVNCRGYIGGDGSIADKATMREMMKIMSFMIIKTYLILSLQLDLYLYYIQYLQNSLLYIIMGCEASDSKIISQNQHHCLILTNDFVIVFIFQKQKQTIKIIVRKQVHVGEPKQIMHRQLKFQEFTNNLTNKYSNIQSIFNYLRLLQQNQVTLEGTILKLKQFDNINQIQLYKNQNQPNTINPESQKEQSSYQIDMLVVQGDKFYQNWDFDSSLTKYSRAMQIYESQGKKDDIKYAKILHAVGRICEKNGQYSKAKQFFIKSIQIFDSHYQKNHILSAQLINDLGVIYFHQQNYHKAQQLYQQSLRIKQQFYDSTHITLASSYINLGMIKFKEKSFKNAEQLFQKALKLEQKQYKNASTINSAITLNCIGGVYQQKQENQKALAYYLQVLAIVDKYYSKQHMASVSTINNVGSVYNDMKKFDVALSYYLKALQIQQKFYGEGHINTQPTLINIGLAYFNLHDLQAAKASYSEALQLNNKAEIRNKQNIKTLECMIQEINELIESTQ